MLGATNKRLIKRIEYSNLAQKEAPKAHLSNNIKSTFRYRIFNIYTRKSCRFLKVN